MLLHRQAEVLKYSIPSPIVLQSIITFAQTGRFCIGSRFVRRIASCGA